MPLGYFILLVMYALRKEVKRWLEDAQRKRKGELFFYLWWFTWLTMMLLESKFSAQFQTSSRMTETCLWISTPFILSAVSKLFHESHRARGKGSKAKKKNNNK